MTPTEATRIILSHTPGFGEETVPLSLAAGRVLAGPLVADRDFPPFTRVAMDGIAIRYDRFAAGCRRFAVEGVQAAGAPQRALVHPEGCLEVMTGAVLPAGADTVIRYEDVEVKGGGARLLLDQVQPGQHIQPQGAERSRGDILVPAGRRISPAEVGVAATVGLSRLPVKRLPRTAFLYTGDELVAVEAVPLPHQIRASNVYAIAALLRQSWLLESDILHIPDDPAKLRRRVRQHLDHYDLLLLSGGVSRGKFDFIPATLEDNGVERLLHRVAQRPGKPFWFGRTSAGQAVFALPGNPVAALMCALRYVLPWLRQSLGLPPFDGRVAFLDREVRYAKNQTYFLPVKTTRDPEGRLLATPREGLGSGDLANLADADGFLELPAEPARFRAGEAFGFHEYRLGGGDDVN